MPPSLAAPTPGAAAAAAQCDSPQSESWVDTPLRGYADKASINKGESIAFEISTSRARHNLDVFRVGWCGGDGASLKLSVPNLAGQNQPVPAPQAGTGLIAANWATSYTLQTDASWVSGFYLVHLTDSQGDDSDIVFVLRDDSQQADIVYQVAFANYQAYNNWGGKSTYDYNSTNCRAYKVSYDRPYSQWTGTGDVIVQPPAVSEAETAVPRHRSSQPERGTERLPLVYLSVWADDCHLNGWPRAARSARRTILVAMPRKTRV